MNYRPITDIWFLARAKLKDGRKFYGSYLGGFPERARILIGAGINDPVLHVCGGMAKHYPYPAGFGPNDETLDLDPATEPTYLQDARQPLPSPITGAAWRAVLIDPPYSPEDATHYVPGAKAYPRPGLLVKNAIDVLPVGGRVGIIHYFPPKPPKNSKFVCAVGVLCGFNNRIRCFSVFQKIELPKVIVWEPLRPGIENEHEVYIEMPRHEPRQDSQVTSTDPVTQ